MDTRYFARTEMRDLAINGKLAKDIKEFSSIGISCISDVFNFLEKEKTDEETIGNMHQYLATVLGTANAGNIYISELTQENLSSLFDDEDLWKEYFNKETDPYKLVKLTTLLKRDEGCWWSEDVYHEAII